MARSLLRRMVARDPDEEHRSSTPLELLFDLCFAVAVSFASDHMHHRLAAGECRAAVLHYGLVFFAIWWAWMNFTWFASAYDTDDLAYRIFVFIQIAGVLVLAAGVPKAFDQQSFAVVTAGYAIMRVGLVAHWIRAAIDDKPRRTIALRYIAGILVCQAGWIAALWLPPDLWLAFWPLLFLAEVLTPLRAEQRKRTSWHPRHIADRYGSFTLIVLGEAVLASTVAIQETLAEGHLTHKLCALIAGGLLLVFSMWWLYFDEPVEELLTPKNIFFWGYGHLFIFAATAAVGAGIELSAESGSAEAHAAEALLTDWDRGLAIAIPTAVFCFGVWALMIRPARPAFWLNACFCVAPFAMFLAARGPLPALSIGLIASALVCARLVHKAVRPAKTSAAVES